MRHTYSIVMFAYNEERNIQNSVSSVFNNADEQLDALYVIANGCTDNTVTMLNQLQHQFPKLKIIEIVLGDKCNAWNNYMHTIAPESDVHFFVDADVQFSEQAFPKLCSTLMSNETANAVAGMPLSGRNKNYYQSLVTERSCLFGNCYGVKYSFIELLRTKQFKLPIGLCWIDSAITKAVNTDIDKQHEALPNRVVHNPSVGYVFNSLSCFSLDDIKLYFSRIARYQTGKLQEHYLEKLDFKEWPENLNNINQKILQRLEKKEIKVKFYLKKRILKRLRKVLPVT